MRSLSSRNLVRTFVDASCLTSSIAQRIAVNQRLTIRKLLSADYNTDTDSLLKFKKQTCMNIGLYDN